MLQCEKIISISAKGGGGPWSSRGQRLWRAGITQRPTQHHINKGGTQEGSSGPDATGGCWSNTGPASTTYQVQCQGSSEAAKARCFTSTPWTISPCQKTWYAMFATSDSRNLLTHDISTCKHNIFQNHQTCVCFDLIMISAGKKTTPDVKKRRRQWECWTMFDKNIFFNALCEVYYKMLEWCYCYLATILTYNSLYKY